MSMINFIKKHEKLLQRDDPGKAALVSLKKRLEGLQSIQPDYQKIADEIYGRLEKESLLPEVDGDLNVGDVIVGIRNFDKKEFTGIKGKLVHVREDGGSYKYGVEWEQKVRGGHGCGGNGKNGYCWYAEERSLKKLNILEKLEVNSRMNYKEFLSNLQTSLQASLQASKQSELEEYLDYRDNDFRKGDEIELVEDLMAFGALEKAAGDRGIINRQDKYFLLYDVHFDDYYYNVPPGLMAKVKKRSKKKGKFKIGDKVEVTKDTKDFFGRLLGSAGERGEIISVDGSSYIVRLKEKDYWTRGQDLCLIEEESDPKILQIIESIEKKSGFLDYEEKIIAVSNDIHEYVEKKLVSPEEISSLVGSIDFKDLNYSDLHDQELEDLLK